jgi:hypothetical protein
VFTLQFARRLYKAFQLRKRTERETRGNTEKTQNTEIPERDYITSRESAREESR